ncbi:glycosyltransferase family 2 protein [Bifidobacterium choloepi]|uniref:glycosyltransferase family 2 protein n=1 Tax=Bifidobacterium choloepi TaxID=2614131 RepID=UPI0013D47F1E|nr:glycosyltransferase [Bifidobacterium choloepi]
MTKRTDGPLVTVIAPVYNVERFLDYFLKTVTEQTYRNLEILLVNDGSPDASGDICRQWAQHDNRIIVVDKPNGGSASARNVAAQCARGEYLIFVDPDDWLESTMIETMVANALREDAQLSVIASWDEFDDGNRYSQFPLGEYSVMDSAAAFREINVGRLGVAMWNKLVRRDLFFTGDTGPIEPLFHFNEEWRGGEDVEASYWAIDAATTIVYDTQRLYHYRIRSDSLSESPHVSLSGALAAQKMLDLVNIKYPSSVPYAQYGYMKAVGGALNQWKRGATATEKEDRLLRKLETELRPFIRANFKKVRLALAQAGAPMPKERCIQFLALGWCTPAYTAMLRFYRWCRPGRTRRGAGI